jgi:hypothetical protein
LRVGPFIIARRHIYVSTATGWWLKTTQASVTFTDVLEAGLAVTV